MALHTQKKENSMEPLQDDKMPKLETEPSEVTKILTKCYEFDNQITLLSDAYHLAFGGPTNLLYGSSNLAEIRTPMNNTLLHIAALYGHDEIVPLIIDHAPKLLFKFNKNNDSVLHVAARGGHISTVKILLASYANFERRDIAFAWFEYTQYDVDLEDYGAMSNMEDILYFVKKENNQGNTMLHEAMLCCDKKSIDGDNNIFKICELYTAEDPFGNSLSKLCYKHALDIVNHEKKSVLYIAVEKGDEDAVKLILEKSPKNDAKPEGLSPVVAAIMKPNKDSEMLRMILEKKPTWIHSSDKDERLPLHYAASKGYLEGVALLLDKCKCCTIQRDKYGYFPIHLASYGGYLEVVKKFLEYCPDPTEMLDTFYGQNILHIASNYGKHKVVKYILKSQIREYHKMINQQDKNGDTPLHLAARSCHPTVVYYLVNHKRVNLDLVNKNKETALDIVNLFDRSSLRKNLTWTALTSAGVKPSSKRSLAHYIESKQSDSNSTKETEQDKDKNQNHVEETSQKNETEQIIDVKISSSLKKRNKEKSEPPPVDKSSDTYKENFPDYIQPKNIFTAKGSTAYKDRVETILLVSTLIVTASVAACFAVPGETADGKANNLCHIMFQLFIIFITISLFSAISSTIILFWATIGLTELVTNSLNIVMPLLGIALISLSLAFMAGLYTVISELTWLANVFLFMTVSFVVVVIFLYMLLFVPSSSTNMPLRYISHYPYLFLASLAEHQIDDQEEVNSKRNDILATIWDNFVDNFSM